MAPSSPNAPFLPTFERLAAHHDRAAFDCGEASLNLFLQRLARQNANRNFGVTHVAVAAPGDARVLGYYTLLVRSVERAPWPQASKLPPDGVGVVLLGRLAVAKSAQGQRIGTTMLLRALKQTEVAAQTLGIYALVVDALNDRARQWYLGFGFEPFTDDPNHLFLTVSAIGELKLNVDEA